jgi:hypothetical protein
MQETPLFPEFNGIFLATFNSCILCHMKISYLMIKSVDCYNFFKISLRDADVLLHFLKFNKQILKNDYFKTLKGGRVFVISIADV